jgi:hypothetical protein
MDLFTNLFNQFSDDAYLHCCCKCFFVDALDVHTVNNSVYPLDLGDSNNILVVFLLVELL